MEDWLRNQCHSECESGAVDCRVGSGPTGNDDTDHPGKSGYVARHGIGVLVEFYLGSQHEGCGDPCHVVADVHAPEFVGAFQGMLGDRLAFEFA
ncbi:MAG: hypothetical protein ACI92G_001287 [Candidatus Pelagisphaera sp.]